ncbi:MAG: glycosidase [Bacillota bacterium]
MTRLSRLSLNPILCPVPEHQWERSAVFNCAAVYYGGLYHLLYRATDLPCHASYGDYVSSLGYAVSTDGLNFSRLDKPVMVGEGPQEGRGIEDPRIVHLEGRFYMMYTGFGGRFDGDYRICLASSANLIDWTRHGVVLDEPNKDASLFPEKLGGRYTMLHRRYPDIWLAFSDDLVTWDDHTKLMSPIPGGWESERLGIAGPPIRTPEGWLLIYHAADARNVYRLGWALLDLRDPAKVLYRQPEPILEPELEWERCGWIPNVVFSTGHVVVNGRLLVYYGAADTCIGVATAEIAQFFSVEAGIPEDMK